MPEEPCSVSKGGRGDPGIVLARFGGRRAGINHMGLFGLTPKSAYLCLIPGVFNY